MWKPQGREGKNNLRKREGKARQGKARQGKVGVGRQAGRRGRNCVNWLETGGFIDWNLKKRVLTREERRDRREANKASQPSTHKEREMRTPPAAQLCTALSMHSTLSQLSM